MKAPRNHSLPFAKWPIVDQRAWHEAVKQGNVLDGTGPASHWAVRTQETNSNHYGRWLAFLDSHPLLDTKIAPRCTEARLRAYVDQLQTTTAPVTVASSIIGLFVVLKATAPQEDWTWLGRISNALKRNAKPSRDKRLRIMSSPKIYRIAIRELKHLSAASGNTRANLLGFRNALMLAVITPCPLRLKNFAALRLGRNIIRADREWLVRISAKEVKNKRAIELVLPQSLTPFIEEYIARVRPQLLTGRNSDVLWINGYGEDFVAHGIYLCFMKFTKKLLGKSINPHMFRDCAATTLAISSPEAALSARDLLGHEQFSTTEKYYIHGQQVKAGRQINSVLEQIYT